MDDLGSKLQEERLKRNIDLQDISKATHISISVLKDIESNNFSKYTGDEEYIKMYLRKYSEYLGIESREFVQDYITLTNAIKLEEIEHEEKKVEVKPRTQTTISKPKYAKSKKVYEDGHTTNLIRYGIILALIIAIFGVIYFMISLSNKSKDNDFENNPSFNVSGEVEDKKDKDQDEKDQESEKEEPLVDEEGNEVSKESGINVEHASPYVYTVNVPANEETFTLKFAFVTQTWCKLVVNDQPYQGFAQKIYNEANAQNDLEATPEEVELTFNTNETYSIVLTNGHNIGHHYYINGEEIETPASEESESNVNITFNIVKE